MFMISVTEHAHDDVPFIEDIANLGYSEACDKAKGLKAYYDRTKQPGDNSLTLIVYSNQNHKQYFKLTARQ